MNQFELAIRIIEKLNEKGKVSTEDLVNDPDITIKERQIQRVLNELSTMHWIQTDYIGRKKVFSLLEDYKLKDSFFSTSEITFILALIDYSKSTLKKRSDFLEKLKNKVFHANSFANIYYMFNPDAQDAEVVSKNREILERCISEMKIINLHYTKYNRNYEVKPYKILFHEGFWYLICEHEEEIKKFVLDFIDNIEVIRSSAFNLEKTEKILESSRSLWFHNKEKTKVKIEIQKNIKHYFERKSLLPGQKITETLENGNIIVNFEVYNRNELPIFLFRWLPHFKILSPKKYVNFFKKELESALNQYPKCSDRNCNETPKTLL